MSSVLRRYTPPTCTLEIAANESPLSRWTDRSVLKHLRFQLSFDDPRLLTEEQVQVTGDRTQLEALHEAVEAYVQEVLDSAPAQFNDRFLGFAPEAIAPSDAPVVLHSEEAIAPEGELLRTASNRTREELPRLAFTASPKADSLYPSNATPSHEIFLTARGLLNHELHLGTLATDESGSVVGLSTLQLFDLANALDEYMADAVALPLLTRPSWSQSRAGWLKIAAIAVAALGVTATMGKFIMDVASPDLQTASSPTQNQEAASPEIFSDEPMALNPAKTPPNLTAVPTPIPGATLAPNAAPGSLPGSTLPPVPVPGTVAPNGTTVPTRPAIPPLPQLAPVPQPAARSQGQPGVAQNGSPNGVIATAPPNSQIQIPTRPSAVEAPPLPAAPETSTNRTALGQAASEEGAALDSQSSQQSAARSRSTAFDTIPQVAELRSYFQQRWTPPDNLTQTLEYRLSVGADGTLQQITPLGQASGNYVDRTGIPLIGEPLVSPLESVQSAQVRLVLSPDGRVQTFLEGTE